MICTIPEIMSRVYIANVIVSVIGMIFKVVCGIWIATSVECMICWIMWVVSKSMICKVVRSVSKSTICKVVRMISKGVICLVMRMVSKSMILLEVAVITTSIICWIVAVIAWEVEILMLSEIIIWIVTDHIWVIIAEIRVISIWRVPLMIVLHWVVVWTIISLMSIIIVKEFISSFNHVMSGEKNWHKH